MEYFKRMLITCLFIGFIHIVVTKPAPDNHLESDLYEDLQGDDDYNYDDEDDKIEDPPGAIQKNEVSTVVPAYFVTQNMTLEANVGEDIILPCDINNFQIHNVVLWLNGSALLTTGKIKVSQSDRISLMENNALKITNLQITDSNDYNCKLLPQENILRIQLNVLNEPRVEIFSKNRLVTNGQLFYRQGEKAEFQCKAFGIENAQLKWSLNGFHADNFVTQIDNGKVYIDYIDSEHAGVYTCLGDIKDSNQTLSIAKITIHVQFSPKVSTHRHYVNTAIGDSPELYCDYKAQPIAIVLWKKNNVILESFSEKYTIANSHHHKKNRSMLLIKNVDETDLGEYTCEVKNKIGKEHVNVHLIFEPETPQFEKIDINGSKVSIYWLVRSLQPLDEAILDYKLNSSHSRWQTEAMISSEKHPERNGYWKLRHDVELYEGLWHARVKTKNTVNWSKFSAEYDFLIPHDLIVIEDNKIPEDLVKVAKIGGGSNSVSTVQFTILIGCVLISQSNAINRIFNLLI